MNSENKGYNPENETSSQAHDSLGIFEAAMEMRKEKRKISFKSFANLIRETKDGIAESITSAFNMKGDLDKYTERLNETHELGITAAEIFQESSAARRDEQADYDSKILEVDNNLKAIQNQELLEVQASKGPTEVLKAKRNLFPSVNPKEQAPNFTEVELDQAVVQQFTQSIKQHDSDNIIEERIVFAYKPDGVGKRSDLYVTNKKTGVSVNLIDLIPKDVSLAPSELLVVVPKDKSVETVTDVKPNYTPNLNHYRGTQNDRSDYFAYIRDYKIVSYGNLQKKGSMLALLHEVAHSWQDALGHGNNKKTYMEHLKSIKTNLVNYELFKDAGDKEYADMALKMLDWQGVAFNPDENLDPDLKFVIKNLPADYKPVPDKESVYSASKLQNKEIYSWELYDSVKGFEQEERVAWAHAIKVLRFLRKQGIDLEPTLKSLKDIQEFMYKHLESYDEVIEKVMV